MGPSDRDQIVRYVVGESRPRRWIYGSVLVLLGLASAVFLLGFDVGLFDLGFAWILVALGIALLAGGIGAGLGPTIGAIWLITLWWFVFPPLVGYLSGDWATASRYSHPRMLAFGYTSARAELLGGIDYALRLGVFFAVIPGTVAYVVGSLIDRVRRRLA